LLGSEVKPPNYSQNHGKFTSGEIIQKIPMGFAAEKSAVRRIVLVSELVFTEIHVATYSL
jgi:hypothetical protein